MMRYMSHLLTIALVVVPVLAWKYIQAGDRAEISEALQRQIGYCWQGVDDLSEAAKIDVVLQFSLGRDGALESDLTIIDPSIKSQQSMSDVSAIGRAVDAVSKCAPYNLPANKYKIWDQVEVRIGPKLVNLAS
tara:strand:+ start:601 stop:999 length:399 start_codon:yes stop_codon:yes gene_type:complete